MASPPPTVLLLGKAWTFKIPLELHAAVGYPEPGEFSTEAVEVVQLPLGTIALIQPLVKGIIRALKAHHVRYCAEKTVDTTEDNLDKEHITNA
ncbi:hypothetical protein M514_00161 [Trichuris suis]|uniref:Uncharacterized protein n=1 Tax=Trichuris suis TaxID=68888 RepID=A0A085NU84_9BILA|nr:hypothetical protein M514_00161 [Trichuris suis]